MKNKSASEPTSQKAPDYLDALLSIGHSLESLRFRNAAMRLAIQGSEGYELDNDGIMGLCNLVDKNTGDLQDIEERLNTIGQFFTARAEAMR
jgi:hypothetical protein